MLRQPVVAWFFAGVFFTVLAHTSLYAFFSLYLDSLGYSKGAVGLMWALGVTVEVAWFWFQGRWVHRLSMHGWLLLAALVSPLRFAATAAFGHIAWVLVLAQCTHAHHLRGPAHGLHRRHQPALSRAAARARPGAVHGAGLRRVGRARRRGRAVR